MENNDHRTHASQSNDRAHRRLLLHLANGSHNAKKPRPDPYGI